MKRIYIVVCLLVFFAPFSYAQVKSGFTIEGSIKGLKTGSKLCILIKRTGRIDTVGQAIAQNGMFKIKNIKLPVYPDFYLLCVQTEFVENLKLFLDQGSDVRITGDLKKWPDVEVIGSKTHDDFIAARKIRKKVWDEEFVTKYPDGMAPSADTGLFYSKKGMLAVVNQMLGSYYIPAMIALWEHPASGSGYVVSADIKKPFYDQLTENVKSTYYGKILGKQIADYVKNKSWMEKLEKSIVNLNSMSRAEVSTQLMEVANKRVEVTPLPLSVKQLTNVELEAKSKVATLILNMGYRNAGDSVTRPNPTSAYVIDESGICVTNYHVGKEYSSKEPYKSLSVMTVAGKVYPVTKILSSSESDDLMVFQVDTKGDKLSALPLGNAAANGTAIHVMAHPMANFYRFTSGVISDYSTSILAGKPCNIMSITADFNIGSSGGPIVDGCGNVVGTVSRIDGGMKVGIPVSELKKLIEFKKGML